MSALTPVERNERRRLRRRKEVIRWSIRVLLVVLVFSLGIALGQAIQDNPDPGNDGDLRSHADGPDRRESGLDRHSLNGLELQISARFADRLRQRCSRTDTFG